MRRHKQTTRFDIRQDLAPPAAGAAALRRVLSLLKTNIVCTSTHNVVDLVSQPLNLPQDPKIVATSRADVSADLLPKPHATGTDTRRR